jgi:hypothetical protein
VKRTERNGCRWILTVFVLGSLVSCAHSAGFEVSGASVTLVGPVVLSTLDDVTLSGGTFDAGNALVQVSGNWTQTAGTFVPGTSTVTFQGASPSTSYLAGSTTFYSFQCVTPGKTLTFPVGSTQTVTGSFILTGAASNPILLRSSVSGSYVYLINGGTNTVNSVDVEDIDAAGGVTIIARTNSLNSGHNVNWFFSAPALPPSGFAGVALGVSSISWTWNAVPGATSYNVYSAAPMTLIMSLLTNSFTETGLTANTSYTRVTTAIVGAQESSPSNTATVSTLGTPVSVLFNNQFHLLPGSPFPRILTPHRPENRRLFFLFENPTNAVITGMITDIRGVQVRDLAVDGLSPFPNSLAWDVKDERGNIVPSGIYLYKITAGDSTVSGGVVVAR